MKIKYFFISYIFLINTSFATPMAISGQKISAASINASVSQIGSIQQSILDETKFQSLSGTCWVLMDGRSIAGTDLSNLTGASSVPDARGTFLRMANNGRSDGQQNPTDTALGEFQADAFQNFTGQVNNVQTQNGSTEESGSGAMRLARNGGGNSSGGASRGHLTIDASRVARTSTETRPKNITVNFFIKVNKACNFPQ